MDPTTELLAQWFDHVLDDKLRKLACDINKQRTRFTTEDARALQIWDRRYPFVMISPRDREPNPEVPDARRLRFKDEVAAFLDRRCAEGGSC